MDFVPDSNVARDCVTKVGFSLYSRAYVITNEDLRYSMQFIPKGCNRALTVAGSGDHPLFCSLYGAKHVDAFDISYNAKCIMDIKVSALRNDFDLFDYEQMLYELFYCRDITGLRNIDKISKFLPVEEYNYLCSMKKISLFHQGVNPQRYERFLPTGQEYNKLKDIVKKSYRFILSDIKDLTTKLTEPYDFIHVSNIFDRIPRNEGLNILSSLLKHVNPKGRILIHKQIGGAEYWCQDIVRALDNWHHIKEKDGINILERQR